MKRIIPKGLAALLFIIGIALASCGPIFDVGDVNGINGGNGGGQMLPPVQSKYKDVKAVDWQDLAEYLQDEETSYNIILEMETANIYLQGNISIVKPMKITGSPGTMYKIHSAASEARNFCLDLQADLDLLDCGFIGYAGTSETANGIMEGSPPINIRPDQILTMSGNDAVLELRNIGSVITTRPGSQVKLAAGASIMDGLTGDLLFKAGVEKLTITGDVSVKSRLTVGSGAILQVEKGGELRVGSGATLTLGENIKELRLDGSILVDRKVGPGGKLVFADGLTVDSLLTRITGGTGSLRVENGIPAEETSKPFVYGANTIIKLSSDGISLGKMISSDLPAVVVIDTSADITIPKGKKLVVGAGVELNLGTTLTLKGGTLEVAGTGSVNVTAVNGKSGEIILEAENKFEAIPRGSVDVKNNGIITIKDGGKFIDESGPWTLELTPWRQAVSMITIESGQAFTLSGEVNLDVLPNVSDASLTGNFTVAGGAILTVTGNLTVRTPNTLVGENITEDLPNAPSLYIDGGEVSIDAEPPITGLWEWKQIDIWDWYQDE